MTGVDPAQFVDLACRLADAAGAAIRPHFREPIAVDSKPDASPVTIADRAAEQAMRTILAETRPDHGIIGEEFGCTGEDREFVWVLDPIDGTKAFISGMPIFTTLVALCHGGRPILGIIDQPISGERWIGVEGRPTTLNGRPVAARPCPDIGNATLYTTGMEYYSAEAAGKLRRVQNRVRLCRYSADAYAFALIATGFVDIVIEHGLKPYDFCALVPVVEGAGGIITDWDGEPLTVASGSSVLAAGDASAHAKALALLADP